MVGKDRRAPRADYHDFAESDEEINDEYGIVIYDAQDMKYESIGKAYRRLIVSSCVLWRCMGCKVLPGAVSHVM